MVTGHYVRRVVGAAGPELHRARDHHRDQSYFLFATTRATARFFARFPLGGLDKPMKPAPLPNAMICPWHPSRIVRTSVSFLPRTTTPTSLPSCDLIAGQPGDIVSIATDASSGFTKGSFTSPSGSAAASSLGGGDALYVVRLEPASNRVVVGPKEALEIGRVTVRDVNWLSPAVRLCRGAERRACDD